TGVLVLDADGIVIYANVTGLKTLQMAEADVIGRPPFLDQFLVGVKGEPLPASKQPWRTAARSGRPRRQVIGVKRSRSTRWLRVEAVPHQDTFGAAGLVVVALAATEAPVGGKAAAGGLYDGLTGLPSLDLLSDRIQQVVAITRRHRSQSALVLLDLDRFREVNETFGHQAGDALLVEVANRLKSALRDSDTISRVVGDQFAAVLLEVGNEARAEMLAGRLLKALETPFTVQGQPVTLGASIGIAMTPDQGEDSQTLMRHALAAMYVAKRDHLGYALYRDEHDPHSENRLRLRNELGRAMDQDELILYYQPKVAYQTGQPMFVEALLRWRHPERGMVPPVEFVEFAEETGLIQPLTRWVLRAAMAQMRQWLDQGIEIGVAVNLSAHNLNDPQLVDSVKNLLEEWRVPERLLHLEVTETAVMSQPEKTLDVLHQLSDLGIELSIDDFGTGFSSLSYLNRLPVHELKIDKSFVMGMSGNEQDEVIVRSTIDLGHNLGLVVVAEGVEDASLWTRLGDLGCDAGQGYYMARPMPSEQLETWLVESPWARPDSRELAAV
ncbi:MAG: EAL domain-containing protein, partial [Chloroflexi bacterium]|nr:EAL domain-containing protein [Chloroflexota bacterium]